jgi:GNAT superfamily N-acetyltransferase
MALLEEIRPPRPEERAAFLAIAQEYLPGIAPERIADMPLSLCIACGDRLLGVAYAEERTKDELCLQGIAVVYPYAAQGRGSALLRALEEEARRRGYAAISLGSADGYVEHFYQKNGYVPTELKIFSKSGVTVLPVVDYDAMDKPRLTAEHGGEHSFFVFRKEL